jgi:post-segregation antitoxin (ccd killing protein)
MQTACNYNASRQNVNISVNSELLHRMHLEKCNLSDFVDQAMEQYLQKQELERWRESSRASFESYNNMVAESGTVSDDLGLL